MKKIVSLLVAIALVMSLSITAFATGTSGSFLANSGVNTEWTAPVSGVATFSTSSGTGMIAVNEGNLGMGTGSVTFNCVEGTAYQIKHFIAGGDQISWSVEVNGGADADATSGTVVIESYGSGDFTAPKDGTIKLTMDYADVAMDIVAGQYICTIANGETINVTAGTTYSVYPQGVPVDATLTWEYVEGGAGDSGDEGDEPQQSNTIAPGEGVNIPAVQGDELVISVSHGDCYLLDSPYRTSPVDGIITHTVSDFMGSGYVSLVNYSQTETLTWDYAEAPEQGGDEEPTEPSEPDGTMGNPFIITELPWSYTAEGYHDVYANFTATEACTLKITYVEGNYISGLVSFDKFSDEKYYLIYVEAGETVNINPWGNESGTYELTLYVPEGGDDEVKLEATDAAVGKDGIVIPFTPDVNGTLSVTISGTPGYELKVVNAADDSTVGLPKKSGREQTVTFELQAGVAYNICIAGYAPAEWDYADATISYVCTFEASEQEVVKEDLLETSVELVVGEQNVELLPNAVTTLFNFYAPEAGVYTITLPEGATAALYSVAWTAYQTSEGNTLVFTATAEGQGFLVGLTSEEASFNVKVEKTGTYTPPAATTYLPYEPTVKFDDSFTMPEGDVTNVDITEAHTAVLGNDGFYHLDTVDGPILYVNLNSDGFTLATLLDAGAPITMRGEKFQDENGDLFCYDYMNMIAFGDYYSYSQECDYYPLNADLMAFFQDYGAAQGWYNANFSNIEAIKSGEFSEESAWMIALVYIADDAGDQGGEGGDNAQTGDFGIVAASLALSLSAICGTALIVKKKEI